VAGIARDDGRFEGGRRELAAGVPAGRLADRVGDPGPGQAPELADLASPDRRPPDSGSPLEHGNRGHPARQPGPEPKPVADAYGAREHPNVRDLLGFAAAFDF